MGGLSWGAGPAAAQSGVRPAAELLDVFELSPIARSAAAPDAAAGDVRLDLRPGAFERIRAARGPISILLPVNSTVEVVLELQPIQLVTGSTRFVVADSDGEQLTAAPDMVLLRGGVRGDSQSHVYLAINAAGWGNGRVRMSGGQQYVLSPAEAHAGANVPGGIVVRRGGATYRLPEFPEMCGVRAPDDAAQVARPPSILAAALAAADRVTPAAAPRGSVHFAGPRVARVAIEADQEYVALFPSVADAQAHALQVLGAVSDIYQRDLNLVLILDRLRLWPSGGEPFGADDVEGFAIYYLNNEDMNGLNLVHLFSGRRDTSYGGIAYVGGTCGQFAFGISAYMLGRVPSPAGPPDLENWDFEVVAHEMGHNLGTFHTHDGYSPPIDNCGNGVPMRGTIMGYCHTHPGGLRNTDMFMHRQVEDVIEADIQAGACFNYDCNTNGTEDAIDLNEGALADDNFDAVPDLCQDCNTNGTIDLDELGADVDANSQPDECQPDCNTDGNPDTFELDLSPNLDRDGNNIPDVCDPDCNTNGTADFLDVSSNGFADFDRDNIPDICQDCDANGTPDWIDLQRPDNLFVCDRADYVREYHGLSGYPIGNLGAGQVSDPYDVVFGADRRAYVASFANDRVVRIDPESGTAAVFVAAGSGGLDGAAGLVFGPNGNLFVTSNLNARVLQYDGVSGALVGTFVAGGSGGLTSPHGLAFGPNGNLFVCSGNNRVLEYNGVTGAFVQNFVTTGSGGLSGPRGLAFTDDGRLIVASFTGGQLLEYSATTGAFIRVFNDIIAPSGVWGVRIGPNGNVFAVRSTSTIRVYEYDGVSGVFQRSYVRGDAPLPTPTGLAFRPSSAALDCDGNRQPDACDPDFDGDLIPDGCDPCPLRIAGDVSGDGLVNGGDAAAFAAVLLDPAGAAAPDYCAADLDGSGGPDGEDIAPFVNLIVGP